MRGHEQPHRLPAHHRAQITGWSFTETLVALRLGDKVVPMLTAELARRCETPPPAPCRLEKELWTLGRNLYLVNSRPDLMTNIGRVIADGLLAQHPQLG